MVGNPSAPRFVISIAARNLRSLTFVRDDNATFGDCNTILAAESTDNRLPAERVDLEITIDILP